MSDTTDDMDCMFGAWEARKEHREDLRDKYIWTQANGEEKKVKKMTNDHIRNTLKALNEGRIYYLEKDLESKNLWITIFESELNIRNK